MTCTVELMPSLLVTDIAPRTGKIIIKNILNFLERIENLLQNGILNFAFRLSKLSEIALEI